MSNIMKNQKSRMPIEKNYNDYYFRPNDFTSGFGIFDYDCSNDDRYHLFPLRKLSENFSIEILGLTPKSQYTAIPRIMKDVFLGKILQEQIIQRHTELLRNGQDSYLVPRDGLKINHFEAFIVRLKTTVVNNGYRQSETFLLPILTLKPSEFYEVNGSEKSGLVLGLHIMNESLLHIKNKYLETFDKVTEKNFNEVLSSSNLTISTDAEDQEFYVIEI